jgi:hypothetical protein
LLSGVILIGALCLALAGALQAQTKTTNIAQRNFEVISVDGNKLVVRDEKGAEEITVPNDFRFMIDGKSMAVSDLKPGMKGTATITTTTTVKPVVITEVREGEVLRASDLSVTVRLPDGNTRRFTQGELDKRDIQILKDGKPVRVADLHRGDKLTATLITSAAPVVLTEKEVEATLAEAKAEPAGTQVAMAPAATQTAATPAAAAPAPAASPQPSPAPAASSAPSPAPPASAPAESSGLGMTWYILIAAVVVLLLYFFMRRRKEA